MMEQTTKINDILGKFIPDVYANHHKVTWEILIPAPWGESGYKQWGLSSTVARCLRSILIQRAQAETTTLFDYNTELKCWHVDLYYYPDVADALLWLTHHPIEDEEWLAAVTAQRESTKARVDKSRQKV